MSTSAAIVPISGDAAVVVEKPTRKFPPPCWTQEETLALIDAYRERWYALRRGYLRTADWDAVATVVSSRCPDASLAKTSAQCRHKMEKLRQRYRAEKQRSLAFPTGRFFSTWFFYENMDAMENGTTVSAVKSEQLEAGDHRQNPGNGFRLKTLIDQKVVKLKLKPKNTSKFNGESNPNSEFGATALNEYSPYLEMGSDKEDDGMDFDGGFRPKNHQIGGLSVPTGFKGKDFRSDFQFGSKGFDHSEAFHTKPLGDESLLPPRYRAKKFGKIDGRMNRALEEEESHGNGGNNVGHWVRLASDRNSMPLGGGRGGSYSGNLENGVDFRGLDEFSNAFEAGGPQRGGGGGVKREKDPIEEMVSSIKMMGEGLMKMEKMKMDMTMEIEKNRMEMEMKRNELILNSQRQIVDAFVKGLFEVKNKKAKLIAESES